MTTTSYSPRDGSAVASHPDTDAEGVLAAVARARRAADVVAQATPSTRRDWLRAVADALTHHADELIELADRETALGAPRLTGEVARAAAQLRFYGDVCVEGSWLGVRIDSATETTPHLVRVNQPLGPVAVFGASNFPFAFSVLGNDTGSALAAGCPVVVKAHPAHVGLSHRMVEIATSALTDAGAPSGCLGLVSGQQAGVDLVNADAIEAVGFTGSEAGGLALWRLANARPRVIPVYAEMGTVNPVVVTTAGMAGFANVAAGFVGSFTLGSGQFCTKPGLLFAPAGRGAARAVAEALTAAAPAPVMLTKQIAAGVTAGLGKLRAAGATVIGEVTGDGSSWQAPAAVLAAPARLLTPGSRLLAETFGAVALVVEYADPAELTAALDALPGSLAATVIAGGADDPDAGPLVRRLADTAGRVTVGDWPTGVAWTWAQHHGGPWPATSQPWATSVGGAALERFVRPVAYQSVADAWLPPAGQAVNPWGIPRRVDGRLDPAGASR